MQNSYQKPEIANSTPRTVEKNSKVKSIIKEVLIFLAIAVFIVLPFRTYIAEPYLVDGRSMDPTFRTGDYLIVDKINYIKEGPERNMVVVFRYPDNPKKIFIKRVIGLPGETVKIKDSKITIINSENPNGFDLDQSYITHHIAGEFSETLSGNEYYVMGDNRAESFDSRYWGPLKKEYVLGKPVIRLWPFSKIEINPGNIE